jgi:hypothetical protein
MQRRGVRDARCADVFSFHEDPFDTVLLLMNGIGLVETLEGLDDFLRAVPRLLRPGGTIVLDSYDPGPAPPRHGPGRYAGEMRFRLEYAGRLGPLYGWLFVDCAMLRRRAERSGFTCEQIWQEAEGHYLARLGST